MNPGGHWVSSRSCADSGRGYLLWVRLMLAKNHFYLFTASSEGLV